MPVRWGLPILGWLRSATAPNGWQGQEGPGGFTTDATGNVYPWGSAGFPSEGTLWPTAATARGVARIPKTNSGYVLDSAGWLHDFGGAPRLTPTATFTDTNIARAIAPPRDAPWALFFCVVGGCCPASATPSPSPPTRGRGRGGTSHATSSCSQTTCPGTSSTGTAASIHSDPHRE